MAKISGSDPLVQLKDQYQQREKESETRHREELRELRDIHRSEIDKVRTEAGKRVEVAQEENSSKLNQKDLHHQKEIESLRAIYAKRAAEGRKPE